MTPPPAATVAGRRVTRDAGREQPARATRRDAAARPSVRPSARAAAAAAAMGANIASPRISARTVAAPSPTRPRRQAPSAAPRRPKAPTRAPARAVPQRPALPPVAPRLALRLRAPRLDRIVRGRAWIPVLGALLVAIVGLRVEVLKLGSSVGRQIQQATLLASSNSMLRSQISALSDNQRITTLAEHYGMHMPNPLEIHILQSAAGTRVQAAIHNITAPSSSTYLTALAAEQQASLQSTNAIAVQNGVNVTATAGNGAGASSTAATMATAGATGSTGTTGNAVSAAGATGAASTAATSATAGATSATAGNTTSSTSASSVGTQSTSGQATGTPSSGAANTSPSTGASVPASSAGVTGTSANGGGGLAG